MKVELKLTDAQVIRLKRQALGAGFLRKENRQQKPWKPKEDEAAVLYALNFLVECVTSPVPTVPPVPENS